MSTSANKKFARLKANGPWITSVALSSAFHLALSPWSFFLPSSLEIRDTEGDIGFPVELGTDSEPPPPEQPLAPEVNAASNPVEGARATKRPPETDAGPPPPDASAVDASSPLASIQSDAGKVPGSGSPSDPSGLLGSVGKVEAGPPLVTAVVNFGPIRRHPAGQRMGVMFQAIPEWSDFIAGTQVDLLRDIDWILVYGPSLRHSDRDVIVVRYAATDALVEKALQILVKRTPSGGPYDTGVPGVKAYSGFADKAARVFIRPQPKTVVVVPPDVAQKAAAAWATNKAAPKIRPDEAVRATIQKPQGPIPQLPETISVMRIWIIPRAKGGGLDLYAEGDCADVKLCPAAATQVRKMIARANNFGVRLMSRGLLNGVEVTSEGAMVQLHLPVSPEQLEAVLAYLAGMLNVPLPAPKDATPSARPAPRAVP